jgi:recombinational DNA repair protein (RecF pathway)
MNKSNIDKCVGCGRDTGHSINDHIDSRKTYIEGSGQLCSECFIDTYKKIHKKDVDINEKP